METRKIENVFHNYEKVTVEVVDTKFDENKVSDKTLILINNNTYHYFDGGVFNFMIPGCGDEEGYKQINHGDDIALCVEIYRTISFGVN